jgi:hypothetical protein
MDKWLTISNKKNHAMILSQELNQMVIKCEITKFLINNCSRISKKSNKLPHIHSILLSKINYECLSIMKDTYLEF